MHIDPAYVKYQNMSANRWKYFRWTPRTARVTFKYVVFFPALVGYLAYSTDVSILPVEVVIARTAGKGWSGLGWAVGNGLGW